MNNTLTYDYRINIFEIYCGSLQTIKCRKCATQMKSSYDREARNDQLDRRNVLFTA